MAAPWYIRKNLVQTFVYWGNPVSDTYGKISFDAPDLKKKKSVIDAQYVSEKLSDLAKDVDLSRYIL